MMKGKSMLYSMDSMSYVKQVPHKEMHNFLLRNMKHEDLEAIKRELNSKIDSNQVHTSSWIPGSDWSNTPYIKIYEACDEDEEISAKMFGLILWIVMMEREDIWSFGRYEKNGIPIEGITYFRLENRLE